MGLPQTGIVWITGAGKGIGRGLAKEFAKRGWTVAASGRTENDLLQLKKECAGPHIHCCPLDITDLTKTKETARNIVGALGCPDLVILNAGTHIPISAPEFSLDDFRKLIDTNLVGTANCLAQILPEMIERRRGHIAIVASVAGYSGLPTAAGYGASKAGLINMCESLKPELEKYNVRMTVINPGFVKTPLTDKNEFPMPFLISVEDAVRHVMSGLDSGRFEIAFPGRFVFLMKLLRILPYRLFFCLTRRLVRS